MKKLAELFLIVISKQLSNEHATLLVRQMLFWLFYVGNEHISYCAP